MRAQLFSALVNIAYTTLLPTFIIGRRLFIAIVWTSKFTDLDIVQFLLAAACFGPAWLISAGIFVTIWRTYVLFPDNRQDREGNIVPSLEELWKTVYHHNGVLHTDCRCRKHDSDSHLLRCGHIVSHQTLKQMSKEPEGWNFCSACQMVAFHRGDSHLTAFAKFTVGSTCVSVVMLGMGVSLDAKMEMKALRVIMLLPSLWFFYGAIKLRDCEGFEWWRKIPNFFNGRVAQGILFVMPVTAILATWSVERFYEAIVELPQEFFGVATVATGALGVGRLLLRR
ncbi:Hypothetical predicted protein [Lecanosticta acicola]|uniref:Uncharacterized protein n=1 Tax=Lecanosticta acicola TaxID=111012 RepID=A0AAI8W1U4_9PEZI|nr:Hypothetical predicted protein [Lecanosticta acicola]